MKSSTKRFCLLVIVLAACINVSTAKAIELVFSTSSKKAVIVHVKNNVITQKTDKNGHVTGVVVPKNYSLEVKNNEPAYTKPESNVFVFSAQTKDKNARSKEYLLYLPSVDPALKKAVITIIVRRKTITFISDLPIEENQPVYAL